MPFWVGDNSPRQTLPLAGFAITCLQGQFSLLLAAADLRLILLASSRAIPELELQLRTWPGYAVRSSSCCVLGFKANQHMEWQQWPSVAFGDRHLLPVCSGIYVIADNNQFIWYVGQAINLQSRWLGRGHHRYPQLIRTNRKLKHRIYWQAFPDHQLNEQERFYIDLLKPELNGAKVKTYLPKQPQVDREIKRLFKTLNRTTLLFPLLRSAIAGAYLDEDGVQCVVTIIYINDFRLLDKSVRKRYSAQVRQAWWGLNTDCGKPQDQYHMHQIVSYHLPDQRFEFVEGSEVLRHLEQHPSTYER